ncbi:MAG: hypothetical protein ACHQEB_03685 [Chitinophagales bacterium]
MRKVVSKMMNINRHNYEEYFILYMDNELGSEDRRMVETFVQNNPDMKEELDILLQSKLSPDNSIVFEGKDELIKSAEGSFISMNNYEEWLVLYMDNELSAGQKIEVEKFIALHPSVKQELEIFNKTRLRAEEEIIFPDKELLYRRTEKVRVIRWWRIAAAAILLLAISTTGIIFLKNRKTSSRTEVAANNSKPEKTNNENNNQSIQTPITIDNKKQVTNQTVKPINKSAVPKNENVAVNEKKSNSITAEIKKGQQVIAENNKDKDNTLPQVVDNPYVKKADSDPIIAENNTSEKNIPSTINTVTKLLLEPSDKKIASANTTDNPDATYASFEEGNNKKTRGFFRKAIRLFTKTTKINPANDDDRVMIGGLAVKMN